MNGAHFANRLEAGKRLTGRLARYLELRDVVVVGLSNGGIPVASAIATSLSLDLDFIAVKKVFLKDNQSGLIGAVAADGSRHVSINTMEADPDYRKLVDQRMDLELRRLKKIDSYYRARFPKTSLHGRHVILIDDGIQSATTITAAISAIKKQCPKSVVVATPLISSDAFDSIIPLVDELICLEVFPPYKSISDLYDCYNPIEVGDVVCLLDNYSAFTGKQAFKVPILNDVVAPRFASC